MRYGTALSASSLTVLLLTVAAAATPPVTASADLRPSRDCARVQGPVELIVADAPEAGQGPLVAAAGGGGALLADGTPIAVHGALVAGDVVTGGRIDSVSGVEAALRADSGAALRLRDGDCVVITDELEPAGGGSCSVSCADGFFACCNPGSCRCVLDDDDPVPACASGGWGATSCSIEDPRAIQFDEPRQTR